MGEEEASNREATCKCLLVLLIIVDGQSVYVLVFGDEMGIVKIMVGNGCLGNHHLFKINNVIMS